MTTSFGKNQQHNSGTVQEKSSQRINISEYEKRKRPTAISDIGSIIKT
jgi:hypothetical protein